MNSGHYYVERENNENNRNEWLLISDAQVIRTPIAETKRA